MTRKPLSKNIWTFLPVSRFSTMKTQWDDINRRNYNTPLLDSIFITPLLEAFSTGKEIIGLCGDGDNIKAMGIFEKKNLFQVTTFQPNQAPLGLFVFDNHLDHEDLFYSLLKSLPGYILNLGILFQDYNFYEKTPDSNRINSNMAFQTPNISIEGSFEDFWNGKSKSFRKQFNNRHNKLQKNDIVTECQCLTAPDDVKKAVTTFGLIESSGWKGRSNTAVHPDNIQGELYYRIFSNFAKNGEVRIYQYIYNGEVVAMDMCLIRDKTLYIMKTTYDEKQKDTSPTQLMRKEYLEGFFNDKTVINIESYGHVKNWHQHVAQHIRPIFIINIYRWPFLKKLHKLRIQNNLPSYQISHAMELLSFDSITLLPAKIKRVLTQKGQTSFFNGYSWYELLEKHALPAETSVKIYVLQDSFNMTPLMIYPILVNRKKTLFGSKTTLSEFSTVYGIEFSPILTNEEYDEKTLLPVFFSLLKKEPEWDIININLLHDSPKKERSIFQHHLTACQQNLSLVDKYYHSANWCVKIKDGDFASYMAARPKKLQNTLRRKNKKLHNQAKSEIIIYDSKDNIGKAIEDYQAIYQSSWKEAEFSPSFIQNFIQTTAQLKILRLGILYIEGKPASFVEMILCADRALIYKLAYVPDYNHFSPGSILLSEMIKHVIEKDGVNLIDFGLGNDPYKRDWMEEKTQIFGIIAFNKKNLNGLIGASRHFLGEILRKK